MATLQITQVGYDKVVSAQQNGLKLSITQVAFGDGTNYVPSASDTALHGNTLWKGAIANCDVITSDILDFLCVCPEHLGTDSVSIGEIGLFLDTGELFALACYPYPFNKAPDMQYKSHALCLSPYLSSAIDVTLTWSMSLPRVNYYGDLPNPERTGDNAYIVNHGFTAEGFVRPSLLTRYAVTDTGPLSWGLLNGNIYYQGPVNVVDATSFTLVNQPVTNVPADVIDFAFVYVYAGTGRTQCRAVQYNPTTKAFDTLYEDFNVTVATSVSPASTTACDTSSASSSTLQVTNLDSTSQVMIWTAVRLDEGTGLVYQARWDATTGYPPSPLRGQFWVVSTAGIINGVCYQVNDWMVYNGDGVWDKVDNTELPYLLYRGSWDASTGAAPPAQPITYYWESLRQGHYWTISKAGTISNIYYDVGDWMVWNGTSWDKIANHTGMTFRGYSDLSSGVAPTVLTSGDYWIVSVSGTINGTYYAAGDWIVWLGTQFIRLNNQTSFTYQGLYNPTTTGTYPKINKEGDTYIISVGGTVPNQINTQINDSLSAGDMIIAMGGTWKILSFGGLSYRGNFDASQNALPQYTNSGDFWVITKAGTVQGIAFDVNDWIVWTGSIWINVNNTPGFYYRGTWDPDTGSVPTPIKYGDVYEITKVTTFQGDTAEKGDMIVWTSKGWKLLLGNSMRSDIIALIPSMSLTTQSYTLTAYTTTTASGTKVAALDKNIVLGNSMALALGGDTYYFPVSTKATGIDYCSCTCTCTCPCTCPCTNTNCCFCN